MIKTATHLRLFKIQVRTWPPAICLIALLFCASGAQAQTLTWDSAKSNTSGGTDGAGTWATGIASKYWVSGATSVVWTNGPSASIGSGGAANNIVVTTPVTVNNLTFNLESSGGYDVSASGAASIMTLTSGIIEDDNTNGVSYLFKVPLTGTNGITKTGLGALALDDLVGTVSPSITGPLRVEAGTLETPGGSVVFTNTLEVDSGATFDMFRYNPSVDALIDGVGTPGGTIIDTETPAAANTLTIGNNNGSGTFSGSIAPLTNAAISLIKVGTGTQVFTGNSTFAGTGTAINGGTLILNGTWGTTTVTASGSLNLLTGGSGYSAPTTVNITGGGGSGAAATASLGLTTASITALSGGSNYVNNDILDVTGGGGSNATIKVTVVGGVITAWSLTAAGTNYTGVPTAVTDVTTTAASGATVAFSGSQFTVVGVPLVTAGSGYTSLPTVSFSGGSGSGAQATYLSVFGGKGTLAGNLTYKAGAIATNIVGSPLTVSNNLTLNNTTFDVFIPAGSSPLAAGTYNLINAGGTLNGSPNPTPNITGGSVSGGNTATVSVEGANSNIVSLVVGSGGGSGSENPYINSVGQSGGNVIVSGINGTTNGTYIVLVSTNLTTPRASWTGVQTNSFDGSGNFIFTNAISGPGQFIDIQEQ